MRIKFKEIDKLGRLWDFSKRYRKEISHLLEESNPKGLLPTSYENTKCFRFEEFNPEDGTASYAWLQSPDVLAEITAQYLGVKAHYGIKIDSQRFVEYFYRPNFGALRASQQPQLFDRHPWIVSPKSNKSINYLPPMGYPITISDPTGLRTIGNHIPNDVDDMPLGDLWSHYNFDEFPPLEIWSDDFESDYYPQAGYDSRSVFSVNREKHWKKVNLQPISKLVNGSFKCQVYPSTYYEPCHWENQHARMNGGWFQAEVPEDVWVNVRYELPDVLCVDE